LRSDIIGTTVARGALGIKAWLRSLSNRSRSAAKDRIEAKDRDMAARIAPTVQERHEELLRFYTRYEELVETICDAAQYGPTPKLEAKFAELRRWMTSNYAPVRRYVVAYLRFTPEDAQQGLMSEGRASDAFEALFAPVNLEEFLKIDDGNMISRITRTREALNLYGEHLRQLLARG
jgi:hypothetical protein